MRPSISNIFDLAFLKPDPRRREFTPKPHQLFPDLQRPRRRLQSIVLRGRKKGLRRAGLKAGGAIEGKLLYN